MHDEQQSNDASPLPQSPETTPTIAQPEPTPVGDPARRIAGFIALAAAALPLVAWLIGAVINPSGWASDFFNGAIPSLLFIVFIFVAVYWYIALGLLVVIITLLIKRKWIIAASIVFVASLALSIFMFYTTVTASDEEFTG